METQEVEMRVFGVNNAKTAVTRRQSLDPIRKGDLSKTGGGLRLNIRHRSSATG